MTWTQTIGQERVAEALRRAVAHDRVAHAYLFHGPDGVGKRAVALALAQSLQCTRQRPDPCDACDACRKVQRLIHPDVHALLPQPSDADDADVADRIRALAEDPYATVDFVRRPSLSDPSKTSNKQATYTIGRINEALRRAMSFRPVEGRYKVVLLTDAELLRTEAANAFLKLLEEPPPQTVFVLTTARPERLLPTIASRCQRFRFDPLPPEAIEAALVARAGMSAADAPPLARMADGSYGRALDLAQSEDVLADRGLVLDFFRLAYTQHTDKLADAVDELSRLGRERIKGVFRLMLRWLRDLLLYRSMGAEAPLVNVDQREAVARFCANVPGADLPAMVALVEEAIELVERNVHTGLVLTTLAHALHAAMHAPHDGRLYVPLTDVPPEPQPA